MKKNILNFSLKELEQNLQILDEKKFRAKQIFNWIYKKNILNFNLMSDLSKDLQLKLTSNYNMTVPIIIKFKNSRQDNSIKFLLKTNDENLIESIIMLEKERTTLCVSCMIGCPIGCTFCATGSQIKFKRNLETHEIVGQYIAIQNFLKENNIAKKINNIVFMGMGEPMLNINNIEKSIENFTSKYGYEISKNKITISTVGITKGLSDFINKYKVKLAISIHFPTDEQRSEYMPINKKISLKQIINELKKINLQKRDFITIEYLMIHEINDTLFHAQKLKDLLHPLKVKINLIPYNPIKTLNISPSKETQINKFANYLLSKSLFTTKRKSRGKDLDGGCGQFAFKN